MRRIVTQSLGGSLALFCLVAQFTECLSAQRPNIVVIVADDLGWNDVSFHGSDQIPTPNIDALAYGGIILNNYYVSPICTPTRGALMSGRHPIHTGLQRGVIVGAAKYGLPLEEKIMPQWFQQLGYRTHMVGKWHLGMFAEQYLPTLRGFESHYGYYQGCEDYFDHTYEANPEYWGVDWRRNLDLIRNETNLYSTDLFTVEAVNIINKHDTSQPLFLYLPHQAVHSGNTGGDPLQAPQHYVDRFLHIKNYHRRLFAGMVAALDDSIGTVVKTLESRGMMNNTIIMFTTDNGGPANGFDANAANNFPLRGVKATLWEGGVRGVGFIHSPLLKKQGYVYNNMLHVCDWLPTLYKAAGGSPSVMKNLDGYDHWESLSDKRKGKRKEILHNIDPKGQGHSGLRVGDYKILVGDVGMSWDDWYPPWQNPADTELLHINNTQKYGHFLNKKESAVVDRHAKYFNKMVASNMGYEMEIDFDNEDADKVSPMTDSYYHKGAPVRVDCGPKPFNASTNCDPRKSPCLFHIPSDPCEYNNIAEQNKDLVIQMLTRLMHYENTMVPPLNGPEDPAGNPKYHDGAWVPWVKL
ncbi:arylsulfatase B-like isoform X4 [Mercenaria mercenaria]|uniref:arylsulfatase B-like isoform X4 n=1 Tax=Mercenaria mercenaria TaxID=6596 RepID=UPI00234E7E36|nr:arylsulfatase B-like isoform X4 [Mercenaria mercenaria]